MIQRLVDEISKWLPWSPTMQVLMLGVEYDTANDSQRENFLKDFCSRLQLTYRSGLSVPLQLVTGKELSSDSGWGCMLRVTQMMLAQCFVALTLGRDWRYDEEQDLKMGSAYMDIVSCFLDVPTAPLSLHRLVDAGQKLMGKEPSAWFGPTSAARAVGHCLQALADEPGGRPDFLSTVGCAVFVDGAIFKRSVLDMFEAGRTAVIVLACRRLGLETLNTELYRPGLESCFALPEFQGLASGNSASSAHFFVATHDDCLLYLDPHRTQAALESAEEVCRIGAGAGLQAARPLPLRWARLNPSLCLAFLVKSSQEFLDLCEKLSQAPRAEVVEIMEREPCYAGVAEAETEDGTVLLG